MNQEKLVCSKCNKELVPTTVNLEYLGHRISYQLPACPICKLTYVSEDVVLNTIHRVEKELEDK
jgi:hypothetical protein